LVVLSLAVRRWPLAGFLKQPTTNDAKILMSQSPRIRRGEEGYILLLLMLAVALMAIAAVAAMPSIMQQVKRDREEEMIHRGVQYSRAIRLFFKHNSRYPTRLEELENTNNIRYLRKRYKDPVNKDQDFRLLHYGEVQMFPGGGGLIGATPAGAANTPGLAPGAAQLLNTAAAQGLAGVMAQQGMASQQALNSNPAPGATDPSGQTGQAGSTGSTDAGSSSNQVFGGGPIVGVASKSKDKTIREFNKKNHYNDWQFIYDPNTDRGGLLNTPAQPSLQGPLQNTNGQPGQPAGTAFGGNQSSPFGNTPAPQQNPNPGQQLIQQQPPDQ